MEKLEVLIARLSKIGIQLRLISNYPWIYLKEVNGNKVKENYKSEHGWVIAMYPVKIEDKGTLTDLTEIFKIIRKYL